MECNFARSVIQVQDLQVQRLVSELKVDEGRYVEDRKFYNKV